MMKFGLVVILISFYSGNQKFCEGAEWNYRDTSNWNDVSSNCAGDAQSPIDIVSANAMMDDKLGRFHRSFFSSSPTSMLLKNNGHSIQVDLEGGYTINDQSVLPTAYKAAQFHLHWGGPRVNGSEHTLNGVQCFGEMHIVHYNTKYANLGMAADKADGLAVLGYFLVDTENGHNQHFDQLTSHILRGAVQYKDETYAYPETFPVDVLLPPGRGVYYRYNGSLTTPNCHQSVIWTVFEDFIIISKAQANVLRYMTFEDEFNSTSGNTPLVNTFRPVQNLNGRMVYKSQMFAEETSAAQFTRPSSNLLVAVSIVVISLFSLY